MHRAPQSLQRGFGYARGMTDRLIAVFADVLGLELDTL